MFKPGRRCTHSGIICLLTIAMVATLTGCTVSYEPESRAELRSPTCVALLTKKLNCEQQQLVFDDAQPHNEFEQQMLPIHQREEVLRRSIDDL